MTPTKTTNALGDQFSVFKATNLRPYISTPLKFDRKVVLPERLEKFYCLQPQSILRGGATAYPRQPPATFQSIHSFVNRHRFDCSLNVATNLQQGIGSHHILGLCC